MSRRSRPATPRTNRVSLVALPEVAVSTLYGIFDVMNASLVHDLPSGGSPGPFQVEIVGETTGSLELASRVAVNVERSIDDVETSDIVIVPSVIVTGAGWQKGRYPRLIAWLARMHARGAVLCSACSGIFVLAETGIFDGHGATVHYDYAPAFAATYPAVPIQPERVLVISGSRDELVTSGASTTWHDMALYLIARFAGATTAHEFARRFALQWHQDGLTPYMVFKGKSDHGDAEIQSAQEWLSRHFSVRNAVDAVIKRSKLAERTFKRRFASATGLAPIAYVQRLRIEEAKRRLERTSSPVDEISFRVGYEDAAFFRRLFKRTTGLAPGAYRKRFQIPEFARP